MYAGKRKSETQIDLKLISKHTPGERVVLSQNSHC